MWIKNDFKFQLITEQFSTLPQSLLNELWLKGDVGLSRSCSHLAASFQFLPNFFQSEQGNKELKKIVNIFQELYYYIILCISFMVAFQLFPFLVVIWSSVWSTHNPQSIKIKVHLSQYHSKFFLMSSSYAEWCVILYSAGILKIFFPLCQRQSMSVPPVQKHGQSLDCCTFSAFSFTNWYLWS